MSNKVMIVGTGNVGASLAFALINQRSAVNELILVNHNPDDALGEAMDLNDALAAAPSYLKISAGTYADAIDCDIIVITAGSPQTKDQTRLDLLQKNAAIMQSIVAPIRAVGFNGIFIVISNPVDILSYLVWQYSGLPTSQVIGSGTVLDSARLKARLAQRLGTNPKSIHAYQIGEHGDSELTVWSAANLGGQPLDTILSTQAQTEISDFVRQEAYRIIQQKGATHYGIATCTAQIINCILNDEHRILTISSYDDLSDTYNGFPAILGRHGVIRRLGLPLNEAEGIKFQQSINVIKQAIRSVAQK